MVRVFIPNDEIEKLGNLGASFSNEALQHHIGDFRAVIAKIRNELPVYQAKDRVSQEETFHAFQQLQKLLSIYSSFDIVYTDGMWKQVDTNPEAKKNIELIGRTKNEIRDMFNMPCFDTDGWLGTLLKKLSVQFAIPVPVLEWYRVKELEGLFDNQFLSDIELERRKLAYAFYIDSDKKHTLYSGADAERLSSEFESETPRDISLIQGTVAHGKGRKVTGTVRLIFRDYAHPEVTKSQMAAMHVGDILVSETTDPDLMEGLKKAGAIVTDSGGMLSHAAITARELNTPCIVGTEIGSKVLKDGDLVEVDADNGVVRVLKQYGAPTKRIYTKTLERDTTLLMQSAFSRAMVDDLPKVYGVTAIRPPFCFHVGDAVSVIFYEDLENQDEFLDALKQGLQKDVDLITKIESDYIQYLAVMRDYWKGSHAKDIEELKKYLIDAQKAILPLALCFYVGGVNGLSPRVAEIIVKLRQIDDLFAHGDEYVRNSLEHFGIERVLANLVVEEELDMLPSNEVLRERAKTGIILNDGIRVLAKNGESKVTLFPDIEFHTPKVTEGKHTLEGQVGYGGVVTGIVCIVRNREDASHIPQNAVLVSPMTTPDFLPAMHKAVAFVTDEGGITCHAAIVAREMKKPCIIGTKFATQVLKDGDLVEVDADSGVVRIIERKSHA